MNVLRRVQATSWPLAVEQTGQGIIVAAYIDRVLPMTEHSSCSDACHDCSHHGKLMTGAMHKHCRMRSACHLIKCHMFNNFGAYLH